jgi:hypothetical protein
MPNFKVVESPLLHFPLNLEIEDIYNEAVKDTILESHRKSTGLGIELKQFCYNLKFCSSE